MLSGTFPRGLISEEMVCEIELDNSGEDFTNRFRQGHIILFKMDFNDGSTEQFEGEVEEIRKQLQGGYFKLAIKGSHWTAKALNVTVTEDFVNATLSSIRTTLISTYLTGFTTTNVETNLTTANIQFVNKPLLDCLLDLDKLGDEDSYFDNDKDLHTFPRQSKNNDNEAVVWDDALIELRGLGSDSAEVRNKIIVYGESGGLPIIHTSEDSNSQATFGTREKVITDTALATENQASEAGNAERDVLKTPTDQGSADTYFMSRLNPGDMVYVIFPPQNVHGRFRLVKYTFKVPEEMMELFFNKERSIPKLFKDRIKKDLAQENIVNPFKMTRSYVFNFDSESGIDTTASSGYIISEGKIRKDTAVETATIITSTKTSDKTANSAHIKVIGEFLDGATYHFRADNNAAFQQLTPNSLSASSVSTPGTNIQGKIIITNNSTRIDTNGWYWKE